MPSDMELVKLLPESTPSGAPRARKRERSFDLSIPALVKGLDAAGRKFEEQTSIRSISAQEAAFHLKARLGIDARVTLFLDIPRTLILESPLRMVLSGAVVYVRFEEGREKSQDIVVRLDRAFRLHANGHPPA